MMDSGVIGLIIFILTLVKNFAFSKGSFEDNKLYFMPIAFMMITGSFESLIGLYMIPFSILFFSILIFNIKNQHRIKNKI